MSRDDRYDDDRYENDHDDDRYERDDDDRHEGYDDHYESDHSEDDRYEYSSSGASSSNDDRYEKEHDDDHYENELDDDRYEYSSSGASLSSVDRYDDDRYESDHDHADHHLDSDYGYQSLSAAALQSGDYLTVTAPGWSSRLRVDYHASGSDDMDDNLEAYQVDRLFSERSGSLLSGGDGSDVLSGRAGWDVITGGSVYRFYNENEGTHFYTDSETEKDSVINNLPEYSFEGIAYKAMPEMSPGATQLYRFYNASKGYHFMTTGAEEALNVIRNSIGNGFDFSNAEGVKPDGNGWGFQYEGRGFRVATEMSGESDTSVYRFFNPSKGVHFYTASEAEANNVITESLGDGYDLSNAQNGSDNLLANGWGYIYEGTAWYGA